MTLRRSDGNGHHRREIGKCRLVRSEQAVFDVEDDFALDEQIVIEDEGVLGEVHRAFDGVLDRYEAGIDVSGLDRIENVGDRGERDARHCRKVGLRKKCLLGERSRRAEIADASNHCIKATGSLRSMFEYAALHPFNASPESLAAELTRRSAEGWEVVSITSTPDGRYCAFLRRPTSGTAHASPSPLSTSTEPVGAGAVNPSVPAAWYKDPSGRYELRYWNGTAWTEHVSRDGRQFTDPPVA